MFIFLTWQRGLAFFLLILRQRQPTRVYKYLEAHEIERVDECLEICKRYKLTDATALLLEKKEMFLEAFSLVKETVMLQLANFNKAFLQVDADIGVSGCWKAGERSR